MRPLWPALLGCFIAVHSSLLWASEGDWRRAFEIIWESRWHQSGYPVHAIKWPDGIKEIRYSINLSASPANASRVREAIDKIAAVIGIATREVPDESEIADIEFNIRRYSDDELRHQSGVASGSWKSFLYTKQRVSLSEQLAYRVVLHELMHAFGFPGHPQGETVLSYFEGNQSSLRPIDSFLLRSWYGGSIKAGMNPLHTVRVLNRLWISQNVPEQMRDVAYSVEQSWFDLTLKSMEQFAHGRGEPPIILFRSGRLNDEGIRTGRRHMQAILGEANIKGEGVPKNMAVGFQYLTMASASGSASAANLAAQTLAENADSPLEAKYLCEWLKSPDSNRLRLNAAFRVAALESSACR